MNYKEYNRENVIRYAKKWAYSRNPKYYNFDSIGGDCTNFVSQCIFAGSNIMNYTKNTGWYYNGAKDRSPSWSGVEYLHNFLITNKGVGPRGKIVEIDKIEIGDIVQLKFEKSAFEHTLIVVNVEDIFNLNNIYTASHTYDSYNRRISTYKFEDIRFIHINNIAIW